MFIKPLSLCKYSERSDSVSLRLGISHSERPRVIGHLMLRRGRRRSLLWALLVPSRAWAYCPFFAIVMGVYY